MRSIFNIFFGVIAINIYCNGQSIDSIHTSPTRARYDILLLQAKKHVNIYQYEQALSILQQNEASPEYWKEWLDLSGKCYMGLGMYKDAKTTYLSILEKDTTDLQALNQLGQLYLNENNLVKARKCYNQLVLSDSMNNYYFKQLAFIEKESNNFIDAIRLYFRALTVNEKDIAVYSSLGEMSLQAEAFDAADSLLEKALEIDTENNHIKFLKARCAYGLNKYEESIKIINEILVTGDTLLAYAKLLGTNYFRLKDYEKVITCMNFLLNGNQESEWIYYYLGVAYRATGDINRSVENLETAVDKGISENISTYYTHLGLSYEENKNYQGAIQAFKAAYESSRDNILLYRLARNYDIYYKDKNMALQYYKRYIDSDDTIKLAKEYARQRYIQIREDKHQAGELLD